MLYNLPVDFGAGIVGKLEKQRLDWTFGHAMDKGFHLPKENKKRRPKIGFSP
jgi:hypothetical protein